jgi:arginine-tRNA-protein transferase
VNKLELTLVRSWPASKEFHESLNEEHELYIKYQTMIHNDSLSECNMNQFKRFLCTSPLLSRGYAGPLDKIDNKNLDQSICGDLGDLGYGSFHQQYRLNGKLIAVGVIDILNLCVSSVYFFYDPAYQFLKLGSYSAMREISLVRYLHTIDPEIKWYYLGFYVDRCRKMRYKGLFYPSYLLCPEVFDWHPLEYCIELLEKSKYVRFAKREQKDQDENKSIDNVRIRMKLGGSDTRILKFNDFKNFLNESYVSHFQNLIEGYCKLFGKGVSQRVLIKF